MQTENENIALSATTTAAAVVKPKAVEGLDDLLIDEDAFSEGRWIQPDPDRPLKIKTKAIGDDFYDAQARRQRSAAKGFGGDVNKLPAAMTRTINANCLIEFCLVDVKNCVIGGRGHSFEEFCELIREKRGQKLLGLAFTAANMAAEARTDELEEAEGN